MTRKSIERDGARIVYEVTGVAGGPTVMLGHSLLCDGSMWRGVEPRLAERFRVINVDARGHGGSTAPKPFRLEDLAADWLTILDTERVDRAALVGLSMGGMTAMRVALRAPSRVAGLAILDSSADREIPRRRLKYAAMAAIVKRFGMLRPLVKMATNILFGKTARREQPRLIAEETERILRVDAAGLVLANQAVFGRGTIHRDLHKLRGVPAMVLVGDEDGATPRFRSERIAAQIHGFRLVVMGRTGHLSALERPKAVTDHLLDFLLTLPLGHTHGQAPTPPGK